MPRVLLTEMLVLAALLLALVFGVAEATRPEGIARARSESLRRVSRCRTFGGWTVLF